MFLISSNPCRLTSRWASGGRLYRGTSLIRNRAPLGPYGSIWLGPYGGPEGGGWGGPSKRCRLLFAPAATTPLARRRCCQCCRLGRKTADGGHVVCFKSLVCLHFTCGVVLVRWLVVGLTVLHVKWDFVSWAYGRAPPRASRKRARHARCIRLNGLLLPLNLYCPFSFKLNRFPDESRG